MQSLQTTRSHGRPGWLVCSVVQLFEFFISLLPGYLSHYWKWGVGSPAVAVTLTSPLQFCHSSLPLFYAVLGTRCL